jgi:hypothetical protein
MLIQQPCIELDPAGLGFVYLLVGGLVELSMGMSRLCG